MEKFYNTNDNNLAWTIANSAQNEYIVQHKKEEDLYERVGKFAEVNSLEDAKELASRIIPTKNEQTQFFVGSLCCRVVNREDLLRISIDSDKEFICFNFER